MRLNKRNHEWEEVMCRMISFPRQKRLAWRGGSDVRNKSGLPSASHPAEPSVNRFGGSPHNKNNNNNNLWVSNRAELTLLWKVSTTGFSQLGPLSWLFKCTSLIQRSERPCLHRNPRTKVAQRRRLCVEGALSGSPTWFVWEYNVTFSLKNAGLHWKKNPGALRRKVCGFDVLSLWISCFCLPTL